MPDSQRHSGIEPIEFERGGAASLNLSDFLFLSIMERLNSPKNNKVSKNFVFNTIRSNAFLPVNKKLIKELGFVEAGVVCNYIDKFFYFEMQNPKNDGWFYLTHNQQMDELNIGDFTIRKVKALLIEKGIIKTKKKGIPCREWMYIDFNVLCDILQDDAPTDLFVEINELDPPKTTNLTPQKQRTYNKNKYNNNKSNKNKDIIVRDSKIESTQLDKNAKYLPLANKLSEIIQTKKNIAHTPAQIKKWAGDIRKLTEQNKVEYARIEKALDWYEDNIGGQYIPVIESGLSLREKFDKLEGAIRRDGYRDSNNKHQTKNNIGSHSSGVRVNYKKADKTI